MEHDIVERIRNRTRGEWANQELLDEAADEIERLRDYAEKMRVITHAQGAELLRVDPSRPVPE